MKEYASKEDDSQFFNHFLIGSSWSVHTILVLLSLSVVFMCQESGDQILVLVVYESS